VTGDVRKVVLVDLSSLFWGAWHACGDKSPGEALRATLDSVARCAKEGDLLAICCDRGSAKRKALLPTYKANRPEKDQVAVEQLRLVKERLEADGRLLWGVDGYEADDVIASATGRALERGHGVLVCTADKDLLQLLHWEGVEVMRTYNGWERWTVATAREKFGVEPHQIRDWLALVGDASDNIKGASGIGPKKATQLLQQFGDIAGIYEALRTDPRCVLPLRAGGVSKDAQALIDGEEQVRLAMKLVTLDPPDIAFEAIYERRETRPIAKETDMEGPVSETIEDAHFEEQRPTLQAVPAQAEDPKAAKPAAEPAASKPAEATPVEPKPQAAPVATAKPEAAALVPANFEKSLEPRSITNAWWLAGALYNSRLYTRFPNQEAILAVILRGRELGFGAAKSLDVFHFFEGKVCPHAHLIVALTEEDPDCEYVMLVESDDKKATYETKHRRHPRPTRLTYTIEQAVAAGLVKPNSNWAKRPAEMLRKTCAVQLARIVFPGAALGLYAVEEMGEAA
jgi:5'-3' exonuclease